MRSNFKEAPYPQFSLLQPVFLVIPILLHFFILFYFSTNIPWIDDFYWYFEFFRKLDIVSDTQAAFKTIITPYNNHWHILQRLLFVSVIGVFGSLNMEWIVILGNVLFVVLFYFLFLKDKSNRHPLSMGSVAAAWLYFQPVSHYNFFECAFFNLPVLLLSFLSIRAFSAKKRSGFFWGLLATFSNGNGLLVWPVGVLMALWHRDWKKALQYALAFIGFAVLYVFLSKGANAPGKFSIEPLWEVILYFIQMCGSFANGVEHLTPWIQTIGGIVLITSIMLITPKALRVNEALYFFMLFLVMSMGIIALTRKEVTGFSAQIVNHYLMFPQLLLGCLIYFLIENTNLRAGLNMTLLVGSILLSTANYVIKLPDLNGHDALKTANLLNYESQKKWRLHPPIQGQKEYNMVNEVTKFVVSKGYYSMPLPAKHFLSDTCTFKTNPDGSILVTAAFEKRILNKTIFVELTDRSNNKTYLPVDRYTSGFADWFRLKKNRRIDITLYINLLNKPIAAENIVSCRLLTVR